MSNLAEEIITPVDGGGANHIARGQRLKLSTLSFYGAGMLVQDTLGLGLGTLLLFYLTVVCGLSGSAAGIALGLALVVDSFIDPLVGSISDNSRSRHGRRHPFMLAAAIPIAVGFGLLFSIPAALTGIDYLQLVASADAAALAGPLRLAALDDSGPAVPDSSGSAVPDASQDEEGEPQ